MKMSDNLKRSLIKLNGGCYGEMTQSNTRLTATFVNILRHMNIEKRFAGAHPNDDFASCKLREYFH